MRPTGCPGQRLSGRPGRRGSLMTHSSRSTQGNSFNKTDVQEVSSLILALHIVLTCIFICLVCQQLNYSFPERRDNFLFNYDLTCNR